MSTRRPGNRGYVGVGAGAGAGNKGVRYRTDNGRCVAQPYEQGRVG
jgi:hypothetical protein